jgi:peptidoglycan-associated lipoprotein
MAGTSPSFPTAAAAARSGSSMSKPAESGNWQPQAPLGFRRGRAASGEPPSFPTHDLGVMMRAPSLLMLLAASAFAGACGGKAAPETPAPEATPAPAPPAPTPVDDSADRDRLERERIAREAAERARAVAADLAAMINFDYDQAVVRPADQATLDRKAVILVANPGVKIKISGHADERGSDEYNLALGNRRAAAAKRYLEGKGVDGSRIEVVSYGEERPLNPGSDESAYAQNRRDEFEVTAGGDNLTAPQ